MPDAPPPPSAATAANPAAPRLVTGSPRRPVRTSVWRTLVGLIGMAAITVIAFPVAAVFVMFILRPLFAAVGAHGGLLNVLTVCAVTLLTLGIPVAIAAGDPRWVFGIRDARDRHRRRALWRRAEHGPSPAQLLVTGRPRRPRVPSLRGLVLGVLMLFVVGLMTLPLAWLAVAYVGLPVLKWAGMSQVMLSVAEPWLLIAGAGLLPILLVINDPDAVFRTHRRPLRSRHTRRTQKASRQRASRATRPTSAGR